MYAHPEILANLARQHQVELLDTADRHRVAVAARAASHHRADSSRTDSPRAGSNGGRASVASDRRGVGRLVECEELSLGPAR